MSVRTSIAIMQPVYLPWLGYFEQMAVCDEFMFLDDVQYTKQDWRNRNRIRTKDGSMWLTIPVRRARLEQGLNETKINAQSKWRRKHLAALEMNYKPCPYYNEVIEIYRQATETCAERLIDITIPLVKALADYLSIAPCYSLASDYAVQPSSKQDRVIKLCRKRKAGIFYTGPAARDYIDTAEFTKNGIEVVFQDYQHPVYTQHFKGFESHMSIIDLLMNYGPTAREILLSSPKPGFAS